MCLSSLWKVSNLVYTFFMVNGKTVSPYLYLYLACIFIYAIGGKSKYRQIRDCKTQFPIQYTACWYTYSKTQFLNFKVDETTSENGLLLKEGDMFPMGGIFFPLIVAL